METSEILQTIEILHGDARQRGLFFQTCEDEQLRGRKITMEGRELVSFGSCSYLSLEYHPALIAGAHDMLDRYGTQFASSRGYLSAPPYPEFEDTLSQIFEAHAVTVQTTTLAHQAAFDVFLSERDAIVLDHQVHFSVQRAATLARSGGARVELVRHEELERAIDLVKELSKQYRTVWFATDGITSMYGDLAPVELLEEILDVADNVRLYVDDAHGMTWCGKYGRGSILSRMAMSERLVVATSLAKAFGAGGAALVFSSKEERERVRLCGGPMVFSGPLQPPLLGAALASAKLHLTPELTRLQGILAERVSYANRRLLEEGLPLLVENEVPIVFVRCGLPRVSAEIAQRLSRDGVYVNVSMYPSVPMRRSGIRCGITASHSEEDIDKLVGALARHVPAVLAEEGVSREELDRLFEKTVVGDRFRKRSFAQVVAAYGDARAQTPALPGDLTLEVDPRELRVERHESIETVDRAEWDRMLGESAHASWAAMKTAEGIFSKDRDLPEHRWAFDYVIVRDPSGRPLAATVFTTALQKDDFLMRSRISEAVEEHRKDDPYFLTSRVTQAGTNLSEGDHLFIDRDGPWKSALHVLIEEGVEVQLRREGDLLMLRDLFADDVRLASVLLHEGFIAVPMPPTHEVEVSWEDDEDLIRRLPSKRKRRVARDVLDMAPLFEVTILDQPLEDTRALYQLYRNVAERGKRLNGFALPSDIFDHILGSDAWEVGTLTLADRREEGAIACWAAHSHGGVYAPLIAGLDYRYVDSMKTYKQLLLQILRRARAVDARLVRLGMTADQEKERWGSQKREVSVYAQSGVEYNASVLRHIVAAVGMSA